MICFWLYDFIQVFLSNANNYMGSSNYFYLITIICLLQIRWFQVTDNNHLEAIIDSSNYS